MVGARHLSRLYFCLSYVGKIASFAASETYDPLFSKETTKSYSKHPNYSKRPNIVTILIDDAGFGDVGYNQDRPPNEFSPTPRIDKLALRGLTVDRFYVQPTCTPTRASLLTGSYAWRNGHSELGVLGTGDIDCLGNLSSVPSDLPDYLTLGNPKNKLLPQLLRENSYKTHHVGKWHLGMSRKACYAENRGFHTSFGTLNGGSDHYAHVVCQRSSNNMAGFNCLSGPDGYDLHDSTQEDGVFRVGDISSDTYSSNIFAERSVEIIKDHDARKPLFLYVTPTNPHNPLLGDVQDLESYACRNLVEGERYICAMMRSVDRLVGRIEDELRQKGMWENTIMWFMSDNGGVSDFGQSNAGLKGDKLDFYEGGVRVPSVLGGGLVEKRLGCQKLTSDSFIDITDVAPTLLGAAGVVADRGIKFDGQDLSGVLKLGCRGYKCDYYGYDSRDDWYGETSFGPDWEEPYDGRCDGKKKYNAIRVPSRDIVLTTIRLANFRNTRFLTGGIIAKPSKFGSTYKYFITPQRNPTPTENVTVLYDLLADPAESHNLISERPFIAAQLRAKLEAATREAPALKELPLGPRIDPWNFCWMAEDDPSYGKAEVSCEAQMIDRTDLGYGTQCLGDRVVAYNEPADGQPVCA